MLKCIPKPVTNTFKLEEMCRFLSTVDGDVVEIGVFQGGSLVYMASRFPDKQFYAYDTFDGMPQACEFDNHHSKGDFMTGYDLAESSTRHLENIVLVRGLYPQSDHIKPKVIMAHLDVDIYESTLNSLYHLKPLMDNGGRIYCDDVFWRDCDGATKALIDFCSSTGMIPKMKSGQFYLQF